MGLGASAAVLAVAALGIAAAPAPPAPAPAAPAAPAGPPQEPQWAYAIPTPGGPAAPPPPAADVKHSLPGTDRTFTIAEIRGIFPAGPADWYPGDHPTMPPIVAVGDGTRGVIACALCHYPNGKGRPENAGVSGLSKEYLVQTLKDMKAGLRTSSERRKGNALTMVNIAKAMTDEEIETAAAYYSSIKWTPWIRVVPSETAPKVRNAGGLLLPLTGADAGQEPLGMRVVEVPENPERTEIMRDPRSGFVAYVPHGAIEAGEQLVSEGGCAVCHGTGLQGLGAAPALAGRSPSYIARQLNDFKRGARKGPNSGQMSFPVAGIDSEEFTLLAAYIASLPPAP